MREKLKTCRRIVVKAGTSILTDARGRISKNRLAALGAKLLPIIKGRDVVLVSSGAIAFGMQAAGLAKRPRKMAELQASAAIGQGKLMHAYEQFFSRRGIHTAQLLLTRDNLETEDRFLRARHTFEALFRRRALPIVNENDTVATEEIAFGDNDILSVHVAHLIRAHLLVILSDVDGFSVDGFRIRRVTSEKQIQTELVPHLKDVPKEKTVGGMRAKLAAARAAMGFGIPLAIVDGREENILARLLDADDVGTLFDS